MNKWILRWVISGIALAIVGHLNIGVSYDSLTALVWATVVLGLVNSFILPLLVILTLPLNCLTLGLFTFVLNAILFTVAGNSVPGFHVHGILGAVLGPILMGLLSSFLNAIFVERTDTE
ncbi:MAG: phage holin family protein [Chthonomonadales bacterium]